MNTKNDKKKSSNLTSTLITIGNGFACVSIILWFIAAVFWAGMDVNTEGSNPWSWVVYSYPVWGIGGTIFASRALRKKHPILAVIVANLITAVLAWWYLSQVLS